MIERDEVPVGAGGESLRDLGSGVYAEWWSVLDRDNWGIVEHHWCENAEQMINGHAGLWRMGSIPIWPTAPVCWEIQAGERGSFDGLTLTPSVLCPRCGLHGWIRDGVWVST